MHDTRIVRSELEAAHPARPITGYRNHHVAEEVGSTGAKRHRFSRGDDEIGLTEPPSVFEARRFGEIGGCALERAIGHPSLNGCDVTV
jgi:hypothetical protein